MSLRYACYISAIALLWFGYATPASAEVFTDYSATTTPQPFSVFCTPYSYGFEIKHYMPQDGGWCSYTLPTTSGVKYIHLYKGVIGNATLLAQDVYVGDKTTVRTQPNPLDNPTENQDYFAVVYDAALDNGGTAFADFLSGVSSTMPSDAKLDTNYWLQRWKWGSVPVDEFDPVIVIPGILGSWEKNGTWVIDPILHTYDNLLSTLKANGYVEGKTLFTMPYNWEQSNILSAIDLENKIKNVKSICKCDHIDLIAHSMGGLVARQYIQSNRYKNDVDQLIFLATPHMGSPFAYQAWEAGVINFGDGTTVDKISNSLMTRMFTNEAKTNGYNTIFDYIKGKPILSIQELLPVYDYLASSSLLRIYPDEYPQNAFLENLDNSYVGLKGVRISNLEAQTFQNKTITGYKVTYSKQLPKWEHGMPTTTYIGVGDGIVPKESIENFFSTDLVFMNTGHNEIMSTSTASIFNILNGRAANTVINKKFSVYQSDWKILFIKLFSPIDMQIVAPDGKRLGKDFSSGSEINEMPDAFYSGFEGENEYAVIVNPMSGDYEVKTIGTGNGGHYTISAAYISESGDTEALVQGTTTPGQILQSDFVISNSSNVITTVSPIVDKQRPKVTIIDPKENSLLVSTDTIIVKATISDDSAIATSTYSLNGKIFDPNKPLSIVNAPTGLNTLLVKATDRFGNEGAATSTFVLVKSLRSCVPDLLAAVQAKRLDTKILGNYIGQCVQAVLPKR